MAAVTPKWLRSQLILIRQPAAFALPTATEHMNHPPLARGSVHCHCALQRLTAPDINVSDRNLKIDCWVI